jgi:hypothetical protein
MPRPRPRAARPTSFAAHSLVMRERRGHEPIWVTLDRMQNELLRLRAKKEKPRPGAGSAAAVEEWGGSASALRRQQRANTRRRDRLGAPLLQGA